MNWIRNVVSILAVFILVASNPADLTAGAKKPNIVIILADDLGYGDLACQGAKDMRTPNIDALFASGMRFNRFYANSCVCSPTRAALLSGRYPELVGVPGVIRTHARNSWGHLHPDAVLLPAILRSAGYHTAIIGKWHLGLEEPNIPTKRGFDYFHGFLGDMMDDYYTHRRHGNNYMRENEKVIDPKGHATDLFSDWAVDYIDKRAESKQPFFLYLAYNAPHDPIQPPAAWLAKVKNRQPGISEKRAKLVALIEHMDHGVGRVVDALKKSGAYENTIIIFTSDNGGALRFGANNGPLRDGKGSMYEGGLRVPMCAVWQKHIPANSRSDVQGITMDLFPTACAAAGARFKHDIEGKNLLPNLLGKETKLEQRPLFFIRREGGGYKGKTIHALRLGNWTIVQNMPGSKLELFDLENDPLQKTDLREKNRDKFGQLANLLEEHIRQGQKVPWQIPGKQLREILEIQAQAWNAGKVEKFMDYYWKSDQLTFSSAGKTTRGWENTLDSYKKRYPTRDKMGTLSFDQLELPYLGDDAALVLGRWHLQRKEDELEGRFSLLFRRIDGRWVIVHDHTSRLEK